MVFNPTGAVRFERLPPGPGSDNLVVQYGCWNSDLLSFISNPVQDL